MDWIDRVGQFAETLKLTLSIENQSSEEEFARERASNFSSGRADEARERACYPIWPMLVYSIAPCSDVGLKSIKTTDRAPLEAAVVTAI